MTFDPKKYRRRDYLPFARHFFGDVAAFIRQGHGWKNAIFAAADYWRYDRELGL